MFLIALIYNTAASACIAFTFCITCEFKYLLDEHAQLEAFTKLHVVAYLKRQP